MNAGVQARSGSTSTTCLLLVLGIGGILRGTRKNSMHGYDENISDERIRWN
jgi:hypothetical protein